MGKKAIEFRLTENGANRMLRHWRGSRTVSGWSEAKKWAKRNGAAGVWRADGSLRVFFMESGKLRQKTWKRATPLRSAAV